MEGASLVSRLTRDNLEHVLEIRAVYADLMRRTPYWREHAVESLRMFGSIERCRGQGSAGAMVNRGRGVIGFGHDTNLSNLSGMLGLRWKRPVSRMTHLPAAGWSSRGAMRNPEVLGQVALCGAVARSNAPRGWVIDRLSAEGQDAAFQVAGGGPPVRGNPPVIEKAIDPQFTASPPGH